MKYKIGDYVLFKGCDTYYCRKRHKLLKKVMGKIIIICSKGYSIEIVNCFYKKRCNYYRNYKWCNYKHEKQVVSLNSLKLKKLVEHGV